MLSFCLEACLGSWSPRLSVDRRKDELGILAALRAIEYTPPLPYPDISGIGVYCTSRFNVTVKRAAMRDDIVLHLILREN
jgi:hypothetical protein